jgi:hypothetical protein
MIVIYIGLYFADNFHNERTKKTNKKSFIKSSPTTQSADAGHPDKHAPRRAGPFLKQWE